MATGNLFLGHARGKVGSVVFSRANGKQITRACAEVVKNPQTQKQMIQRIILNTVSQAYSRMAEITDHSFEGVPAGQKSMSYFMQKNMDTLRERVARSIADGNDFNVYAFAPIGSNDFAVNDFILAKGTLPQVDAVYNDQTGEFSMKLNENTYQGVCDKYGLERGDQITFVSVEGTSAPTLRFYFARVILDPTDALGAQLPMSTTFINDGAIVSPSPRNEGEFVTLEFDADEVKFQFTQGIIYAAAIIVSRQSVDGTWRRSNAQLVTAQEALDAIQYNLDVCLQMFESSGIDTKSQIYLNNAGKGRLAGAGVNSINVETIGGDSVTLVGLKQVSITNTGAGTSGITSAVAAVDSNGNTHLLKCDNQLWTTYGNVLTNKNGLTSEEAWPVKLSDITAPAGAGAAAVIGFDDSNNIYSQPIVNWLISQGVAPSVFQVAIS